MLLVVDMNMSTRWVTSLQDSGLEAVHWSHVGHAAASDAEIIAYAKEAQAVILTRDFDFGALVAQSGLAKPSIVHLRDEDRFVPPLVRRVLMVLHRFAPELTSGAIISIDATRSRVRLLPIGDASDITQ